MSDLYGLHCPNPKCVHDSIRAYRLRFMVRPDRSCAVCRRTGRELTPNEAAMIQGHESAADASPEDLTDWWTCSLTPPCEQPWRRKTQRERNDLIFRLNQLDSALSQMELCGASAPALGVNVAENHHSIPVGFDMRLMILKEEPMPRMALYLRWKPDGGQILHHDMCYQGMFAPDMTAEQRRQAQYRHLLPEEFSELVTVQTQSSLEIEGQRGVLLDRVSVSRIKCQHCLTPLPLKAFNTSTLHEAAWGD